MFKAVIAGYSRSPFTPAKKGKLATNPQLVEKAIRIINDLGVSTMTPAETREKLKLKNYK